MKKGLKVSLWLLISAIMTTTFSSCAVLDKFNSLIGLDTYDYMGEEIVGYLEEGSEEWTEVEEMLHMLAIDGVNLPEFDGAGEAHEAYRESLLNYMLNKSYSMYAGNPDTIDKIRKIYPEYEVIAAIPKNDFESAMYRYFGGSSKITHKSTTLFNYLTRAESYVPASSPIGGVELKLISAAVTERSYRASFTVTVGDAVKEYFALIIRREDNTLFFRTLIEKDG